MQTSLQQIDYPLGSTVWTVLQVKAIEGLADFYRSVLGWELEADNGEYFFTLGGKKLAEVVVDETLSPEEIGWLSFLGTDDLRETTERAIRAGATIVSEDRNIAIPGAAVELLDPFGARFGIAQLAPGGAVAQSVEYGRLILVDPTNHDVAAQLEFQQQLFPNQHVEAMGHGMNIIRDDQGVAVRGAYGLDAELREVIPPHWLPWFSVSSQASAVESAEANGGRVNTRDNELPFGIWGVVVDPQGGQLKTLQMTKSAV